MKDIAAWNEGDWIAAIAAVALFAILAIGGIIATRKSEEVVGHPRGLFVLFYAEMWERFSYYGMRALLILYLTKFWLFNDGKANLIYGAYTSLVYITPVLGGYLADRWLGQRKAVLFGGVVLALGHLFMAYEGMQGITDPVAKQADFAINVFWLALALIIVGSGFLKANISVIVGQLYRLTDNRRDAAYTIFYMGVNVGAALGTILVGYLGETVGWSWGFGIAGIGMVLGLIIFVIGKPALRGKGEPPVPLPKASEIKALCNGHCRGGGDLVADPVPERHRRPAGRGGRGDARLHAVRGIQAAQGAARANFRDPLPDRAQPGVLGPVRAGRRLALALHRQVCRPRRSADQPVPVDQPDLHRALRSALRGAVAMARQARARAFGAGQIRAWRCSRSASASWSSSGAPKPAIRR